MDRAQTGVRTRRTFRSMAIGLFLAAAVVLMALAHESASSPAPAWGDALPARDDGTTMAAQGVATAADGVLPGGVSVFDDEYPGVARLAPDLLRALRAAASDAADEGVVVYVNSGWRSPAYQDQLLREAVSEYGSERAAARWVATPSGSAHVSGDAVDIGPPEAAAWLSEHGVRYGLCPVYRNEPWHFELSAAAGDDPCPRMYADPTHDPRTQR